jgi:DNA-binding transcriptional MerR regulator
MGLVKPKRESENGYRQYDGGDLDRLQQILLFRACGFRLEKIGKMLDDERFDRLAAFRLQRNCLLKERMRIDAMLETLEKSMQALEGGYEMSDEERFKGFDMDDRSYEQEARDRWGDEAVDRSNGHLERYTDEQKKEIGKRMEELFGHLATLKEMDPASKPVQEAMETLYRFFAEQVGYPQTYGEFGQLGKLYDTDERFERSIDRYGEGLSRFLSEAIAVCVDRKR